MSDYDLGQVDRLVVGTIGPVGQRVFLLQARRGDRLVTLKIEKYQVQALSEHLASMLERIGETGPLPEDFELEEPYEPEWVVGSIGVSYVADVDRFIFVVEEATEEEESGLVARLAATKEQAAALAARGAALVAQGRPPCPFCGYPLDPRGHSCPKSNGHQPPLR
jgi:uncharacterized repeat protein (TIGR03847 family)